MITAFLTANCRFGKIMLLKNQPKTLPLASLLSFLFFPFPLALLFVLRLPKTIKFPKSKKMYFCCLLSSVFFFIYSLSNESNYYSKRWMRRGEIYCIKARDLNARELRRAICFGHVAEELDRRTAR